MEKQDIDLIGLAAISPEGTVDPELREYLRANLVNMFKLDIEVPIGDWWSMPLPPRFKTRYRLEFRRTAERTYEIRVVPAS